MITAVCTDILIKFTISIRFTFHWQTGFFKRKKHELVTAARGDKGKNQKHKGTKDASADVVAAEELALMAGAGGGASVNGASDEPEKWFPAVAAGPGGPQFHSLNAPSARYDEMGRVWLCCSAAWLLCSLWIQPFDSLEHHIDDMHFCCCFFSGPPCLLSQLSHPTCTLCTRFYSVFSTQSRTLCFLFLQVFNT